MKFTKSSALNLVLSGLKISTLAIAMVAIVACGKKDDNSDKKDDYKAPDIPKFEPIKDNPPNLSAGDEVLYTLVVKNEGSENLLFCQANLTDTTTGLKVTPSLESSLHTHIGAGEQVSYKFDKSSFDYKKIPYNEGDDIKLGIDCFGSTDSATATYNKGGSTTITLKPVSSPTTNTPVTCQSRGGFEASNGDCFQQPPADEMSLLITNNYGSTLICEKIRIGKDNQTSDGSYTISRDVIDNGERTGIRVGIMDIERATGLSHTGETLYVQPVCTDANRNPVYSAILWHFPLEGGKTHEFIIK